MNMPVKSGQLERRIAEYYARLRKFSPPSQTFFSEDKLLERCTLITNESKFLDLIGEKTVKKGGAAAGVGIGGTLETFSLYAGAEALCYVDFNPLVTHVFVPALGVFLLQSKSREDFIFSLKGGKNPKNLSQMEQKMAEKAGMILEVLNPYLEADEKKAAEKVLFWYFWAFTTVNDNSRVGLGYWWKKFLWTDNGHYNFWMATDAGWKYMKNLWENGLVRGMALNLTSDNSHVLMACFSDIGFPLSLFYSSNVIEWVMSFARHSPDEYAGKIKQLTANILSIPRQAEAVWIVSFLLSGLFSKAKNRAWSCDAYFGC